ncbi:hypothetical protein E2C01_017717 [Portunus trituberculatus]|uniref:Uncharacterized protein n=1 Tax=Portunus trituberculatus TaxID=210409 RepID=A0A5B7DUA6_PORTR|nr:hypothetical protein [Portunus trituberculatus]
MSTCPLAGQTFTANNYGLVLYKTRATLREYKPAAFPRTVNRNTVTLGACVPRCRCYRDALAAGNTGQVCGGVAEEVQAPAAPKVD